MVFKILLRRRRRNPVLIPVLILATTGAAGHAAEPVADRAPASAASELAQAKSLYSDGQYFTSARYAFSAALGRGVSKSEAYSWLTVGLVKAGLYHSAAYFFIRTLQTGRGAPVKRVLGVTEELLTRVGGDLLRRYLIRHTRYGDYDTRNRSAYLYSLGKDALLQRRARKAVGYLDAVSASSPLWGFALQLRATAHTLLRNYPKALSDFRRCRSASGGTGSFSTPDAPETSGISRRWLKQRQRQAEDLWARCMAGEARVLYETGRFHESDRAYDRIPKSSFVWTDILFEQAWAAFAQGEYNRTLGRLVSYKSPALEFVFNTEVDVLRAQAYLALCLYDDANKIVNAFNRRYSGVGKQVKRFVERNGTNLRAYYRAGRNALRDSLHTSRRLNRVMNRFIRGPYFQNLVEAEEAIEGEIAAVDRFGSRLRTAGEGLPEFLKVVLNWRRKTVAYLGGAFVRNSMLDHHKIIIADFEKMAFIKLEMLSRAKDKLMNRPVKGIGRFRGNVEPERRDDQYRWSFNGEFWNDELGDYVFGLESQCNT